MIVIFTIFGMFVFMVSIPKKGFKTAFFRLLICTFTGALIDAMLVALAYGVLNVTI